MLMNPKPSIYLSIHICRVLWIKKITVIRTIVKKRTPQSVEAVPSYIVSHDFPINTQKSIVL